MLICLHYQERINMATNENFGVSIFKARAGEGGNLSRRVYNLIMGLCLI